MLRAEQLHEKVLSRMDFMREPSDEELLEIIHSVLEESSKKQFIPLKEKAALGKELFNAFRKLDILQEPERRSGAHVQTHRPVCDPAGTDRG